MNKPSERQISSIAAVNNGPIAIGGVGGSGTRVIAEIAKSLGVFMGETINGANDNLAFVKSRKLLAIEDDGERASSIAAELNRFEQMMQTQFLAQHQHTLNWGWKVPGQFHLLKYTASHFSELKYIHVIRHGLDMAFSKNQNQLRNWGPTLGIVANQADDPVASLDYWISANNFAIKEATELLGDRFLLLNFDDLCNSPEKNIFDIANFVVGDAVVSDQVQSELLSLVVPPKSINRYKTHDYKNLFSAEALNAVEKMGFAV